jgi:hypothetical protein
VKVRLGGVPSLAGLHELGAELFELVDLRLDGRIALNRLSRLLKSLVLGRLSDLFAEFSSALF